MLNMARVAHVGLGRGCAHNDRESGAHEHQSPLPDQFVHLIRMIVTSDSGLSSQVFVPNRGRSVLCHGVCERR